MCTEIAQKRRERETRMETRKVGRTWKCEVRLVARTFNFNNDVKLMFIIYKLQTNSCLSNYNSLRYKISRTEPWSRASTYTLWYWYWVDSNKIRALRDLSDLTQPQSFTAGSGAVMPCCLLFVQSKWKCCQLWIGWSTILTGHLNVPRQMEH